MQTAEALVLVLTEDEPDWCWNCSDIILPSQGAHTESVEIADPENGPSPHDIWEVRMHNACEAEEES